jgi:hypothetical protein
MIVANGTTNHDRSAHFQQIWLKSENLFLLQLSTRLALWPVGFLYKGAIGGIGALA